MVRFTRSNDGFVEKLLYLCWFTALAFNYWSKGELKGVIIGKKHRVTSGNIWSNRLLNPVGCYLWI